MHIDLLRTSAKQKLRMHVPLHFLGEDVAPGIKEGGLLSHTLIEAEIECLPADLPEFLEVDVSELELNGLVHLSEIKLPKGVAIPALAQGEEYDQVVASIHLQKLVIEDEEGEEGEEGEVGEVGEVGEADEAGEAEDAE